MKDNLNDTTSSTITINLSDRQESIKESYQKLLKDIGNEGKYQKMIFILLCLSSFILALLITSVPFQKDIPNYTCLENQEAVKNNFTFNSSSNVKLITDVKCVQKFCSQKMNSELNVTLNDYSNYSLLVDYNSIKNFVTNLDILCSYESFFAKLTQMIFLGRIFGNVLFSYISDKYGRYIGFTIQFYILCVTYILFIVAKNEYVYLGAGLAILACSNIYNLFSAISTEVMSLKMYSLFNGMMGFFFSFCGIFGVVISYYFKFFDLLVYIHLSICVIIFYLIIKYFDETPLYLLDQERYTELNKLIKKIGEVNGTFQNPEVQRNYQALILSTESLNSNIQSVSTFAKESLTKSISTEIELKNFSIDQEDKSKVKNEKNASIIEDKQSFCQKIFGPYFIIFHSREIKIEFLKLIIPFLSAFSIYYGQILNVEKFSDNIYLTSFVIYLGEMLAEITAGYLLRIHKRKILIGISYFISMLSCLITAILNHYNLLVYLQAIFILGNSYAVSQIFIIIFVYGAELFESSVKSTMISLLVNLSFLFMLLAVYIYNVVSPFFVFFILSGLACLNSFILRETKND
jgi:MFS family permease